MTMLSPDFAQSSAAHESPSALVSDAITELLRTHARTLMAAALEAEAASVVAGLKAEGAGVIRNGYLLEPSVTTAIGDVKVKVPRIRGKDSQPVNFTSTLIPKYLRRSSSISAWAAYAYLKGVSEAEVAGVLEVVLGEVLGEGAKKLTPSVVSSLKKEWTAGFDAWGRRDLSGTHFTYIYADGIYQQIRGDNPKICALVIVGVDESGKKHLVALEDGVRESSQSWRSAPGSEIARDEGSGAGGRRRGAWLLGGALGGLWHHRPPAVLVPQEWECHELPAQVDPDRGAQRPVRDLDGAFAQRGAQGDRALSGEV